MIGIVAIGTLAAMGIWGVHEVGHALKTGYKNIGCLITSGHRCPKAPKDQNAAARVP